MSGSIFDRERLRPTATPTQVVGLPGRPNERAAPVRRADPMAPNAPTPPRRPPPVGDLAQLAAALSSFSPVLNQAATGFFRGRQQEEAQTADADATDLSLKENVATWADAVRRNPELADRSPFYRQMFEERLARQSVLRRGNELHAEYWASPLAGSADPAAIQGWMSERLKDTLESYRENPAARAAAAEELRNQAVGLTRTHQQNARVNLVSQNEDSFSQSVSAAFDTHSYRTGGRSADTTFAIPDNLRAIYQRVAQEEGMPVGILMAQGAHESNGFEDAVLTGRRRGGRGEIGLAQVLPSTARDPGYGVTPITEQGLLDPEQAIRFQARYMKARGRAAGVTDFNDPRQMMTALAAYNGTGTQAQGYAQRVMELAGEFRASTTTGRPGPTSAHPGALMAELQSLEAGARAQGIDGRKINQLLTQATAAAMIRTGRTDYAELGASPRSDGTPGFGTTAEARIVLENARRQVMSNQVQEENLSYTRTLRAQKAAGETLASSVAQTLVDQLAQGQTPQLSPEHLRIAARVDPGLITTFATLANTIRGVGQTEDVALVAQMELRVNSGEATVQDVMGALGTVVKDPDTIRRLLTKAQENASGSGEQNVFRNPVVTQLIRETQEAAAGVEGSGIFKNHGIALSVGNAMREAAATFQQQNPRATQADLLEHLRKTQRTLVPRFNEEVNIPAYDARASSSTAPDPRTPAPAPDAGLVVQPNSSVNTGRVAVFGSLQALEEAYTAWRRTPGIATGPGAAITAWIINGGVQDINKFYDQQKRLLQQQGANPRR